MHAEGGDLGSIAKYLKERTGGGLPAVGKDKDHRPSSFIKPLMACLRCSTAAAPVGDTTAAMAQIKVLTELLRLPMPSCT